MNEQDFIMCVRDHAMKNYENGGWSEIVECWDDGDIMEYLNDADGNAKKAFKEIKATIKLRFDYAEDIRLA